MSIKVGKKIFLDMNFLFSAKVFFIFVGNLSNLAPKKIFEVLCALV